MQLFNTSDKVIFTSTKATTDRELVEDASLNGVSLQSAKLERMDLRSISFVGQYFEETSFRNAFLDNADFTSASLHSTNFHGARLRGAKFERARFDNVNFNDTDLSGATGLPSASDFLNKFRSTRSGIYVFKAFGNTFNNPPTHWVIKKNSVIEEAVNPCRTTECGCGVNFGTMEWIKNNMYSRRVTVWECLIPLDKVPDIVVPYSTDGKARCSYLKLIKPVCSW